MFIAYLDFQIDEEDRFVAVEQTKSTRIQEFLKIRDQNCLLVFLVCFLATLKIWVAPTKREVNMEVGDVHFFVQTSDCEHCPPPGGVSTLEAKPSEPDF